jgi:cobalt-zinc-cadmium efflux system membrane fusion protein
MLSGYLQPALRRAFALPRKLSFAVVFLLALVLSGLVLAHAHEGHDHGPPEAAATLLGLPRLATKSETYELVAILEGERLTLYLDRYEDNAPITDANITVMIDGEPAAAEATADGTYALTSKLFGGRGLVELVFDVKASEGDDLLIGKLALPNGNSTEARSTRMAWYEQAWSAARHGARDHLLLVGLAVFGGLVVGLALRTRRTHVSPTLILMLASLATIAMQRATHAHEGGHDDPTAPVTSGDTARRLPGGQVFVPKPMQRILDVRTLVAKGETVPKTVTLVGRVITDPNRSGVVQSISGGRVIAPSGGLPRTGQAVAKGQVLAEVERALQQSERTTISEKSGEIEQQIAVTEAKLKRLRELAARGVALQSLVVEAELELEGLRRRREVIRETRIEPEPLRAPIDGVIAISRVVAGQVVRPQDLLFQIVDPNTLWVEAYDYGDTDPATLQRASAAVAGGRPMKLTFQGWSRTLQQQATVLQFAIADPPGSIRVGQPVTVSAELRETATGMIISRDAVARGSNGEAIVWRHVEPEQFEPRPVRIEPFDATRVLIAAGIGEGERIVVRGAELINQIH